MKWQDKLFSLSSIISRVGFCLLAIYTLGIGFYRSFSSNSGNEKVAWIIFGFIGAFFIMYTFLITDFGLRLWEKLMTLSINQIRKYPEARRWIVFPSILISMTGAYYEFRYLGVDLTLRFIIGAYLVLFFPALIISLVRDDIKKENTKLSKIITRQIQIDNPQAAIENAFTHFEDCLRKKFPTKTDLYGNGLIKAAYNGEESVLIYKIDGKDHSEHLYHLMSGAYSLFRNPRHHKIIYDDEQKTQAIISLVELLTELVDTSKKRRRKKSLSEKTIH
jgi:hypothetical protein